MPIAKGMSLFDKGNAPIVKRMMPMLKNITPITKGMSLLVKSTMPITKRMMPIDKRMMPLIKGITLLDLVLALGAPEEHLLK